MKDNTYPPALYQLLCPNCDGDIEVERCLMGLPCSSCMKDPKGPVELKKGSIYERHRYVEKKVEEFEGFFKEKFGRSLWSLQLSWAKRFFYGQSFSLSAPTGVGKTTFGVFLSAFLEKKSYIIVPTKLLLTQVEEQLKGITNKKVLAYRGKAEEKEEIERGNFHILITTSNFFHRNYQSIPKDDLSLVFVDDVDSFLKSPRAVHRILEFVEAQDGKSRIQLLISSATLRPKPQYAALFRKALGFDIQSPTSSLRNVEDLYLKSQDPVKDSLELVKRLGRGGLVFLSQEFGKAGVEEFVERLREEGIPSHSYKDFEKVKDEFERGDVWIIVGISSYNNPLCRGLNLPHAVRYAIFVDPPKLILPVKIDLSPSHLFSLLVAIRSILKDGEKADEYISYLRKYTGLPQEKLDNYPRIKSKVEEVANYLKSLFEDQEFLSLIESSQDVSLRRDEDGLKIVVGDANTYIQASGRTSRLYPGGVSKGISIVVYSDEKAFRSLQRRLRFSFSEEVALKPLEEVDLERLLEEVDRDRELIKRIEKGEIEEEKVKTLLKSVLVVVESPNKARTIAHFFGRPSSFAVDGGIAYEVSLGNMHLLITATMGHVTDLVEDGRVDDERFFGVVSKNGLFIPEYGTIKKCSCGNQTTLPTCPRCGETPEYDKKDTLNSLRRMASCVDMVFIATDPDAEGEKIAFDVFAMLKGFSGGMMRAEFHEVTPKAFRRALDEPREVSSSLVKAQMVRRIGDRWVGFSLSKKLQESFKRKGLSAGRVQTPVLGWVIEREEVGRREKKTEFTLSVGESSFRMEVDGVRKLDRKTLKAKVLERKRDRIKPPPPYNTPTLLTDLSSLFRLSAERSMQILQELFEKGLITYHRTDSTRVSDAGISLARRIISERFGEEFFKGRSWGEGGAHECIRPTRFMAPEELREAVYSGRIELEDPKISTRVYDTIWRRFLASQMREVEVEKVKLGVEDLGEVELISQVIEDGFNLVSPVKVHEIKGELIQLQIISHRVVRKYPPYTQGTLIEEMRRRGLGRPSTYAKIVSTLLERGYVVERKNLLFPTPLGKRVYEFLRSRYSRYTDEGFTRELEELMDMIEEGKADYTEVLRRLYQVREVIG